MNTPPYVNQKNNNQQAAQTPRTPIASLSFSRELKQVLQERNLFSVHTRKKVCRLLVSSPMVDSPNTQTGKLEEFRMQAIDEILSTERAYLEQLEILVKYFITPLKAQAIIDDADHTLLFGQIEMIHNLNRVFLKELEENKNNVARAFLKMTPFFKLYSVYAFDYRSALLLMQNLHQYNPVFRKFLESTESRPEVQRKLNSLMIVPIQRVPRYKLLLDQVLFYTSPADPDFKLLKESIKQVQNTVAHINSCVQDQEVIEKLLNLQNSLVNRTPNIVIPSRKVLLEGILQKVTHRGHTIRRYCVLFSDVFMYCKLLKDRSVYMLVENSLTCCCIFPLKKCKVYELFPGTFKLTCQGDGIIFGSDDHADIKKWINSLRNAINEHIEGRLTLRKESSKRKPLRKRELKHFDIEYVLPAKRKKPNHDDVNEQEDIFRNKPNSDSEEEGNNQKSLLCFSKRKRNINETLVKSTTPLTITTTTSTTTLGAQEALNENAPFKLSNYMCSGKSKNTGILKRKMSAHENDIYDTRNLITQDALFPLRNIENEIGTQTTESWPRKRVKFDESILLHAKDEYTKNKLKKLTKTKSKATTLRERIYSFFANLF